MINDNINNNIIIKSEKPKKSKKNKKINNNKHKSTKKKKKDKKENKANEELSNDEIILRAIELCKDHNGSRIVQKKIDEFSEEEKERFIQKIKDDILNLCEDIFGNYVIQKILQKKEEKINI